MAARVSGPKGDSIVRLALDTGATTTLVRTGILVELGYDPGSTTERVPVITGSGIEWVPKQSIQLIETLGQVRTDFPCSRTR